MSDAVGETPEVRPVTSVLYRLGGLGARHPWRVIGAWMLVVLAVGALSATYGGGPTQSLGVPGSDSQRAFDLLEDRFPEQFGGRARVVFAVDGDRDITAASYRASIDLSHRPLCGRLGVSDRPARPWRQRRPWSPLACC